jgi:hypothetical protein
LPNAGRVPENRLWTQFAPKQAFKWGKTSARPVRERK